MRPIAAAFALAALVNWSGAADDPKAAAQKLEGTYEVVDVRIAGKPDPKRDELKSVVIKGGTLTITKDQPEEPAKFTLDPAKAPAHIDIAVVVNAAAATIPGLYEAKETEAGLELTIALRMGPKAARPTNLKGEGKDEILLKLLRRKAK